MWILPSLYFDPNAIIETSSFLQDYITFEAERGGNKRSQIAIQDISVMPGPCHTNLEHDLAGRNKY